MQDIAQKVAVSASPEGLILQPLALKGRRTAPAVRIAYKNASIGPLLSGEGEKSGVDKFECFGVVGTFQFPPTLLPVSTANAFPSPGILTVLSNSYLITITKREQVAQLHSHPIYCITDVSLTPLTSYAAALASIKTTRASLAKAASIAPATKTDSTRTSLDTDEEYSALGSDDVDDEEVLSLAQLSLQNNLQTPKSVKRRSTTVVSDVFSKKGGYGKFARNWFGRTNSGGAVGLNAASASILDKKEAEEQSVAHAAEIAAPVPVVNGQISPVAGEARGEEEDKDGHVAALLPKLLRTTSLLFGSSRSFFFAYDYDITRAAGSSTNVTNGATSLHQQVDPLFFWNKHVTQPFIDAGQYSLVLPLMQGFVGQKSFTVERHPAAVPKDEQKVEEAVEIKDFTAIASATSHDVEPVAEVADAIEKERPHTPKCDDEDHTKDEPMARSTHEERERAGNSTIDNTATYLLTIISRRSVERAGLRYLRRGVDDNGHVANSVETEQILSTPDLKGKTYSFVQIRGSIPVFFSQTPYSFKPVPQLSNSDLRNYEAFRKHFGNLKARYGNIMADNLVEKHDNEAIVGDEYQKYVDRLNKEGGVDGQEIAFEWFDFHHACRGMKFENVSLLIDTLAERLDNFGYTVLATTDSGEQLVEKKQSGVLRTNCMDCLDRTNVTQSAVAWRTFVQQLSSECVSWVDQPQSLQESSFFNILWADNGDAISRQYASTAALKGDFTRTKKRDYRGVIADAGLSISRFYSGIVNDYFSQTSIDYLLGTVTARVWEDFATYLMSADPAISISSTRERGIEIAYKLVVADPVGEELVGGWAFIVPTSSNTVRAAGGDMEEAVLLLTERAIYLCRMDWGMEKVRGFERVDLRHVTGVKYGTYITSTLTATQRDEKKNVGIVIRYMQGEHDMIRVNTRSLSTVPSREDIEPALASDSDSAPTKMKQKSLANHKGAPKGKKEASVPKERIIALKCLPSKTAVTADGDRENPTEEEMAKIVADEVGRLVQDVFADFGRREIGKGGEGDEEMVAVERGDIIGVREASKSTGWVEVLGWKVKKLVWA